MSAIHKLEFLEKYGTDNHKQGVADKVHHMVNNIPPRLSENPYADEDEHRRDLARSHLVQGEHLTKMVHHKDHDIRAAAAENPNLSTKHIDSILDGDDHRMMSALVSQHNPNARKITTEHLHRVIDNPTSESTHPAWPVAYRKDLKDEHWAKLAKHHNDSVARFAVTAGTMPMNHLLDAAVSHPSEHVRHVATMQHFERTKNGE